MEDHAFDREVIRIVGDRLADVAEVYRAAAETADGQSLKERLLRAAAQRSDVSRSVLGTIDEDAEDAGTALSTLAKLNLKVDEWIGDDDDAAIRSANAADADLLHLVEGELQNRELRESTRELLRKVAGGLPRQPTPMGLQDLANKA